MENCSAASTFLTDSLELELGTEWCKPPYFSCAVDNRGEGKHFSGESYLCSGALKRLILNLDPLPTNFEEDTLEIFGIQWVTETALVNSSRELFHLFRQQLYNLETLLQSSCDFGKVSTLHCKADNIRQQCVLFLHYVKVFIFRYLKVHNAESHVPVHPYEALEAQLPSLLIDELHGLLLYIGHLSELPSINIGAFVNQNQIKLFPPSWHLLHLHLDIHWLVLEILYMLGEKLKQVVYGHQFMNLASDSLTNVSLFEEHCETLLCDLISLSLNRYDKVRPSESLMSDQCPCLCIKELWVLLIHLLDHRSKWSVSESFWNWLNKLLKTLLEKSSDQRRPSVPVIQSRDPLGFSWWIITHVASFYQFDRHGVPDEMRKVESNWNFVEELLKKSISVQGSILEEQLRMYLHCCLTLCDFWEPNIAIVTILWEYYSKNLNSSFSISWLPFKGLANTMKSPLSMLEMVKTCYCDKQDQDLYKSSSSYTIFLCILAKVVKKAMKSNGPHPWKQVKGRIYSKFHQKRMEELTEVGLQNFFSLFLLLAAVAEVEDVASHVLDLLNFLKPAFITSQRALIWKGHMAFLLMYAQKNVDIGVLAEKFSCAFREKAKEFLVSKNEEMIQRQTLWTLLSIYIDGVQEVFETSYCLYPSHEKLLNDGFSMLLRACRESELRTVLSFLQAVLARIRSMHQQLCQELQRDNVDLFVQSSLSAKERHLAAVASALWRHFFSFLKSQRMSQVVPFSQLADAAAGILVKSWAQIFATSKAQKLLFRIIDCLLLPHTVLQQEKELPAPMLSAIQKSLPLYLQGICVVCCQSQNPSAYLNQLLGNVIEQYIGRFLPASPYVSDLGQHPVLLALRNTATVPPISSLKKCVVQVIRKSYLEYKGSSPPPRLACILAFILQLFKETNTDIYEVELLLPGILKCLVLVSEPQVKRLATENLQYMVKACQVGSEEEPSAQLTSVFRQFIQDYGMRYYYQVYSILETVATLDQQVVIHLISTLTQSLKDSEQKWGLGRNIAQREAYSKLLSHLGQVGQDEMQRLENDNT
ncbi:PREDICTED: protein MMS22-like isoform X4 [Cercocebus atys]|uniref:protein MMS22-like isoform X4 n=1 Tax=Cercocebus atys TaxID=9531 RepID=UPI0005F39B49|nr:PREDICTED: protein MMS22-like isoform X4 [Cercocebus atys]